MKAVVVVAAVAIVLMGLIAYFLGHAAQGDRAACEERGGVLVRKSYGGDACVKEMV